MGSGMSCRGARSYAQTYRNESGGYQHDLAYRHDLKVTYPYVRDVHPDTRRYVDWKHNFASTLPKEGRRGVSRCYSQGRLDSLISSKAGSLVSSRSITPRRIVNPKLGRVHPRLDEPQESNSQAPSTASKQWRGGKLQKLRNDPRMTQHLI